MRKIIQYITYLIVFLFITACDKVDDNSFNKTQQTETSEQLFVLQNDKVLLEQNQSKVIFFLENDSVPSNIDFTFSKPKHGHLLLEKGVSVQSIEQYSVTYLPNTDFFGKDSIVYTVCAKGICKNATIYIQVVSTKTCQWKEMPLILQDIKLKNLQVDSLFLDFSDVECALNVSFEGMFIGWINVKEIQKNQFMIVYKAPEKENFYDKIQLNICNKQSQICKSHVLLYQNQLVCNTWVAKNDAFILTNDTNITTQTLVLSKEKLFANDEYCSNVERQFQITKMPLYGKLFIKDDETFIYYSATGTKEDTFAYKVCNEKGQCTEAIVKIIIN